MSRELPFPIKKTINFEDKLKSSNILDFLVQYITISYNVPKAFLRSTSQQI